MELGQDGALDTSEQQANGEELPECRVISQCASHPHLALPLTLLTPHHTHRSTCKSQTTTSWDHIEWDLLSPLTPEEFSIKLAAELGLTGEAVPLIAHAVHEELLKHKKDAIEWGVIGGDRETGEEPAATGEKRDRSGFGLVKDKTGLGLGWGRAPRDGVGRRRSRALWRDWADAEEFRTTFEELTAEEVERREIERERATRYVRVASLLDVILTFLFLQAPETRDVQVPELDAQQTTVKYCNYYYYLLCALYF